MLDKESYNVVLRALVTDTRRFFYFLLDHKEENREQDKQELREYQYSIQKKVENLTGEAIPTTKDLCVDLITGEVQEYKTEQEMFRVGCQSELAIVLQEYKDQLEHYSLFYQDREQTIRELLYNLNLVEEYTHNLISSLRTN